MLIFFRALLVAGLAVFAVSCSSTDNSEPPAPLTDIKNALKIDVLWTTDTDAGIGAGSYNLQPLLVQDRIFTIDTDGLIKSIDANNGKLQWRFATGIQPVAGLAGNDDIIIASSRDGELNLYARVSNSLVLRWSARLKGEIRSAPVIGARNLFIRTMDGRLSAVSIADGDIQWAISHFVPTLSLTGNSSPVLYNDLVIAGFDDGKILAFDKNNGQQVWQTIVSQPKGRSEIERLVDIDGQFVLKDGVIYVSSYQGRLAAIQAINGEQLWSRNFSSFNAIAIDDQAIYLTSDDSHIWSIDRRTGSALWAQDVLHARKVSAPLLFADKLIVGDLHGYVHWFNKSDGSLLGRIQPGDERYYAQPFAWRNKVLVMDSAGSLSSLALR